MKKVLTKTKKGILLAALATTVLLAGLFIILQQIKTYPLGNDLEYVGKSDYGCYLLCDANPDSTLYYATDKNIPALDDYFSKAHLVFVSDTGGGSSGFTDQVIRFKQSGTDESFYGTFYEDGNAVSTHNGLPHTTKKHVISFRRSTYQTAKESL